MRITVELPDDIARRADPGRHASRLLGLSRLEFEDCLIERKICDRS